jgi:hypothetical protein
MPPDYTRNGQPPHRIVGIARRFGADLAATGVAVPAELINTPLGRAGHTTKVGLRRMADIDGRRLVT